jgi:hypothetical protein
MVSQSRSGVASSGNLTAAGSALVSNCIFGGTGITFNNISNTDLQWYFSNNKGIKNTSARASVTMENNITASVIGVAGTYVNIAGATAFSGGSSHFTSPAAQVLQYDGLEPRDFQFVLTSSVRPSAVGAVDIRISISVNGVKVPGSTRTYSGGISIPGNASFSGLITLNTGDTVRGIVTNITNTTNIIVGDMALVLIEG